MILCIRSNFAKELGKESTHIQREIVEYVCTTVRNCALKSNIKIYMCVLRKRVSAWRLDGLAQEFEDFRIRKFLNGARSEMSTPKTKKNHVAVYKTSVKTKHIDTTNFHSCRIIVITCAVHSVHVFSIHRHSRWKRREVAMRKIWTLCLKDTNNSNSMVWYCWNECDKTPAMYMPTETLCISAGSPKVSGSGGQILKAIDCGSQKNFFCSWTSTTRSSQCTSHFRRPCCVVIVEVLVQTFNENTHTQNKKNDAVVCQS